MNYTSGKLSDQELLALQESSAYQDESAQVVLHDLATEDTSLGFNESAIDMINERFTRQLRVGLMDVLRTTPKISIERVKIKIWHVPVNTAGAVVSKYCKVRTLTWVFSYCYRPRSYLLFAG